MNSNKKMAAVQDKTTQIAAVNTYKNTEDDENEIDLLDMGMALLEKLPYIILCFLIGEMLETYLRRGIMQYKSFSAFFARPIFDVFFFIAIGVLVWTVTKELKAYKAKKQAA